MTRRAKGCGESELPNLYGLATTAEAQRERIRSCSVFDHTLKLVLHISFENMFNQTRDQ